MIKNIISINSNIIYHAIYHTIIEHVHHVARDSNKRMSKRDISGLWTEDHIEEFEGYSLRATSSNSIRGLHR